jgi:antitoxin (DNA-binding transcriptional repressor) of toxin-antitoxin stability system
MERYSLEDAQMHLEKLIAEAREGKMVVILDENNEAVQLISLPSGATRRKAGSARGLIKLAADFDAPLDDFSEYMG